MGSKIIKILFVCVLMLFTLFTGYFLALRLNTFKAIEMINEVIQVEKTLEKYSIENLSKTLVTPGEFRLIETIDEYEKYSSHLIELKFSPNLSNDLKVTTGILNLPTTSVQPCPCPMVLMLRGYVDQKLFTSGMGTTSGADYFADNGYITIAPDFLGYGGSSTESENVLETRFQTYTTVLALINGLKSDSFNQISDNLWSGELHVWAHSNGGHVALTVLEITGEEFPTVLWAPVTKPFPYSVLYYTDESEDGGKFLRKVIADFEKLYNSDHYSLTNFIDKINAPIQIHQGGADDAVPQDWTDDFVALLENNDKKVEYIVYPEADHNMRPNWEQAIEKSLLFFNTN